MTKELVLVAVGVLLGMTTVWFGFGGGFVAVPVVAWADHGLGGAAVGVATSTSLLVMLVNAVVATAATPVVILERLRHRVVLLLLLALGGALGAAAGAHVPGVVLRWGFVGYLAVTAVDLLVRPGFFTSAAESDDLAHRRALPNAVGVPIGGVAAFLGVGGSVMTVPMLRRAGVSMAEATTLANPLTVAIVLPAAVVALVVATPAGLGDAGLVGLVDVRAAAGLLVGAIPTVVVLRRRPVPVSDRVHAWVYLVLLLVAGTAVAVR